MTDKMIMSFYERYKSNIDMLRLSDSTLLMIRGYLLRTPLEVVMEYLSRFKNPQEGMRATVNMISSDVALVGEVQDA